MKVYGNQRRQFQGSWHFQEDCEQEMKIQADPDNSSDHRYWDLFSFQIVLYHNYRVRKV